MPRDISVIGPLNIDLLIVGDGPEDWSDLPTWDGPADMQMTAAGSVGYNVSDLAKLGLDVKVSSCVPDDPLGAFIREALRRDGVDVSAIQMVPETLAGIGVYMLLFGSRKRPLTYRLPSHTPWPQSYSSESIDDLLDARVLHNGGYLHFKDVWHGVTVDIFREARSRGVLTSMDPQFPLFDMQPPWMTPIEDILESVDILFCDETEARMLTAEQALDACARVLLDAGPELVIIKQGAKGSTIFKRGWQYHQKAVKFGELVDSIGAGDAFDASFLYATLQDWPLEERMLFSSVAAGFTVTGVGGTLSFPKLDAIKNTMKAHR
jgi:sugar/nucleoside kinase (ribokinase family)